MKILKKEQQFEELLKNSSIEDIQNYIIALEHYDYKSFCSANAIAAVLSAYSSFIWDEKLTKATAVILAFCKIYSEDGIIEVDHKHRNHSIVFPKTVKSLKQISIINHLGEDCGYPDTIYSIFSTADDLLQKHGLSIDITDWISSRDRTPSDSDVDKLVDIINKTLNIKEALNEK